MAGDAYLASRRLAGGVARKSETPMGILGISIQQRLVDCMGIARRGVCADRASSWAGRVEYPWGDEKQTSGQCNIGSGIPLKSPHIYGQFRLHLYQFRP